MRILLILLEKRISGGNTVVIVEHNTEVICSADWVVDLGTEGGDRGGQLVVQGTVSELIWKNIVFLVDTCPRRCYYI